ncbi:MAG: hypothetical protein HUJ76_08415 [Parasporobacterium sp.]|nr:hypothetical protein [Parasporobacterium sp.]
MDISRVIEYACELGATRALENMGVHSGTISRTRAIDTYGKWFVEAEIAGRIRPFHIGTGSNGKKSYRIADILALRVQDAVRAELH